MIAFLVVGHIFSPTSFFVYIFLALPPRVSSVTILPHDTSTPLRITLLGMPIAILYPPFFFVFHGCNRGQLYITIVYN